MPDVKTKSWLEIARNAAGKAGEFLLKGKAPVQKVTKEIGKDIKIQADVQAEQIIIDYLKKYSNFPILSEETGLIKGEDQEFMWVIDPLDGTFNYTKAMPLSCVSIGFWRKDAPILGCVYNFNDGELFSGIASGGAWLNAKPLRVSDVAQKEKASLCTGFPINTDFTSQGICKLIEDSCSYKKIRMLGSAALSIAYVASARADAYYEKDIMLWDIAGGIPIVLGAGGKFNMEKTKKPHAFSVFASNGRIMQNE